MSATAAMRSDGLTIWANSVPIAPDNPRREHGADTTDYTLPAQALQDSHERQRVQRQLYGSAPSAQRGQALFWRLLGALGLLALVFSLGFYVGQQSHKLRGYVD